ncbi:hypothetical protein, partial [Limosilactobacillus reuteri]|uniref:hypothetical protein n=1 Tax=Limosilactobacillus reuteri TaxID=1598 RepID=UPI00207CCF9C
DQLLNIGNPFDVAPQVQTLTSDGNSNLNIENALFENGNVRSFRFFYAIYRTNTVTILLEQGQVNGIYDPIGAVWTLQ